MLGESPENCILADALEQDDRFKRLGLTATCGPTGSVVIDYDRHVRGVWHFHNGHYFWINAGGSQPSLRVETVDKAVQYTLDSFTLMARQA